MIIRFIVYSLIVSCQTLLAVDYPGKTLIDGQKNRVSIYYRNNDNFVEICSCITSRDKGNQQVVVISDPDREVIIAPQFFLNKTCGVATWQTRDSKGKVAMEAAWYSPDTSWTKVQIVSEPDEWVHVDSSDLLVDDDGEIILTWHSKESEFNEKTCLTRSAICFKDVWSKPETINVSVLND